MLEKHREKMGASVSSGKTDVGGLRGDLEAREAAKREAALDLCLEKRLSRGITRVG